MLKAVSNDGLFTFEWSCLIYYFQIEESKIIEVP